MMESDLVTLAFRSHGWKIARPVARRLKKLDKAIAASGLIKKKRRR